MTGGLTLSGIVFEFFYSNSLIVSARRQIVDGYSPDGSLSLIAQTSAAGFRMEWGWLVLFAGAFLLLAAAGLPIHSERISAGDETRVTQVQRVPRYVKISLISILSVGIGMAFVYQVLRKSGSVLSPAMDTRENRSTSPWSLLKNPFRDRKVLCIMDLRSDMIDGSFDFNRMISENVALYDYEQRSNPSIKTPLSGQIAVIVDPQVMSSPASGVHDEDYPAPWKIWKVEPMGTLGSTNAFSVPLHVPLVKFWGYYEQRRPGRQPQIGEIWMLTETAKLEPQHRVSDGRPYIEQGPTLAAGTRVRIANVSHLNGYEEDIVEVLTGGQKGVFVTIRGKYLTHAGQNAGVAKTATLTVNPAQGGPQPGAVRVNPQDGLKYVWIPAGTYTMGCSPGDKCHSHEKPSHSVTISKGFWMGQTEVTVGAYKRFAQATGRAMPSGPPWDSTWKQDNLPMVNVTWNDARSYCTWAGGRLPTGAEWEYAARAGTQTRYYFGNDAALLGDYAWYSSNSGNVAHPVGQKKPNAWGLYDMLGNVWDWCQDWFGGYYPSQAVTDPQGPSGGQFRILRGGSWFVWAWVTRVSMRYGGVTDVRVLFGFRCVREVIP